MKNVDKFRLDKMEMLETSHGIFWTADITLNGKKVGWVEDDAKGCYLNSGFDSKEIETKFIKWSELNGDPEWKEEDLVCAGLYALSELYAIEVEGVIFTCDSVSRGADVAR